MKKFYSKLSRPQWRITVPNINNTIFNKTQSPEPNDEVTIEERVENLKTSGSYDLVEEQKKMDAKKSSESLILKEEGKETEDSDEESRYEDASPMMGKKIDFNYDDTNIYADVENLQKTPSEKSDTSSLSYEYDIPRISFSFFESECLKAEIGLEKELEDKPIPTSLKRRSEIKIVLSQPPLIEEEEEDKIESNNTSVEVEDVEETPVKTDSGSSLDDISISATRCEIELEPKVIEMNLCQSLDELSLGKISRCDSEPSLELRLKELDDSDEEGLYKIPRSHKRLSQSLSNFNTAQKEEDPVQTLPSQSETNLSSAQPEISSPIEVVSIKAPSETTSSLDYIDARSKLPAKIRRATLLRRPHMRSKAQDTWSNLRSKVSNIIQTHSAAQRVGANTNGEKVLNLEEFYKSSRTKCRKLYTNTSKIFKNKKDQENINPNSDTASQIVKNDAFFAKVDEDSEISSSVMESEVGDRFGSRMLDSDFDIGTLKSAFRRSKYIQEIQEGQNGFEDLRRFVKQGGDFCKELSAILQERSEAEQQYAKSLSKLSAKLARACRDGVGGLNEAFKSVAQDMEQRGEAHRQLGTQLSDDVVRPLRQLCEQQHKVRKQSETIVDKAARGLADWRAAEAKAKKHSHACARDNEKLQDQLLDVRLSKSTSLIQLAHMHNHKAYSDKESAKLEGKKRKAEDAVKKADIEYYTLCVRAERARLEWESAVVRGSNTFQTLEEDRLKNLKSVLTSYLQYSTDMCPKIMESTDKLRGPAEEAEASKDMSAFINLRNTSQQISEQLLPDFYCEHITLAMNRERRKQALVKLLHLIRQDLERERKSKNGLENLSRAIKQTPNFGSEDSQQNVSEKLYHMRSMLTYLEGGRYKLAGALCELENRQRAAHPLAQHITVTRDKSGLQQSVLKVPQWLKEEFVAEQDNSIEKEPLEKTDVGENELEWNDDRGMADGNSNQHDSDFDEFSSEGGESGASSNEVEDSIDKPTITTELTTVEEQPECPVIDTCRALYVYTANLPDELSLRPGDTLHVYRKQEDGWWLGECNGAVGIFPATYVETIQN